MQSKSLVTFITVNYNQMELTLELIDSIYQHTIVPFEIIVVDNDSKVNPKEKIQELYPDVRVIVSGVNRGFAGGNNIGVRASEGEYLFFINNDAVLTEGALETMLNTFTEHPDAGIVCPLICYYPENEGVDIIQYAGATDVNPFTGRNKILGERVKDQRQYRQSKPTFYAHGAGMLVPRKIIEEVGSMSEDYFLYYEELDWCERIRKSGYSVIIQPNAKIYHKESMSVGQHNPIKTYYLTRNRILFMAMNRRREEFLFFILFLLLFTIPKNTLMYLIRGQKEHLQAFYEAICWHFKKERSPQRVVSLK